MVNKQNFDTVYELKENIGSGSIAEVWSATHIQSKDERAVKIIRKSQKSEANLSQMIKDETASLATLESPNIVKICEVFEDENKYYVVMELLKGPNMSAYLAKTPKSKLNEKIIASWLKQILQAVSHCHSKEIIHGDIRPSNFVFAEPEAITPKMIDFNFSKAYDPNAAAIDDVYAAPAYIAPEILTKKIYTKKTDIWGIGILAYFMVAARTPYEATSVKALLDEIKKANITEDNFKGVEWEEASPEFKKFILRMLTTDEEKRPSAEELLSDSWLGAAKETPLLNEGKAKEREAEMIAKANERKFRRAMKNYMIYKWELAQEKKNLANKYKEMDKNKDGLISKDELKAALKVSGIVMSPLEFDKLFFSIDTVRSGTINFQEYMAAFEKTESLENDKPLADSFEAVVNNNNKVIKKDVLLEIMKADWMADCKIVDQFNGVHKSAEPNVTFAELKKALTIISVDKQLGKSLKTR